MSKHKRLTLLALTMLIVIGQLMMPVAAEGPGFSATPVLPDNQKPGTSGYFNLAMQPGQTQDLTVTIKNTSDEDMSVTVEVIAPTTNINGIINYTTQEEQDPSLRFAFTDLAKPKEESINVPAGSSVDTDITVTMPGESFDGMVLGSIQVKKDLTEEDLQSDSPIVNQFSYVIGVRLSVTDNQVAPNFELGEVNAELTNFRASIVAKVRNVEPVLVQGMRATADIYAKGGASEAVLQSVMEDVEMAPNSFLPLTLVDTDGYGVQAGDYIARIHLEYEGQTWDFEQEFTIEAEQAAAINENAVVDQEAQTAQESSDGLPVWVYIVLGAGGILLILVIVLMVMMMKKKS